MSKVPVTRFHLCFEPSTIENVSQAPQTCPRHLFRYKWKPGFTVERLDFGKVMHIKYRINIYLVNS